MTDLVLVYNHKYEQNIPKLDRFYAGKFNKIWHLVPFYRGREENVIAVYGGSFVFQGFIAQAAAWLRQSDAERFLFLSDDLLLDPGINQRNLSEHLGLEPEDAFIGEINDLSTGGYMRGVNEGKTATLKHPGLEIGRELPPPEEALRKIERHLKLESLTLRRYRPYSLGMLRPMAANIGTNWKRLKGNLWHRREQAKHWLTPKQLCYPMLGGYADIFSTPRTILDEFAHLCGVFASAQIFVELALPTALALCAKRIRTDATCRRPGFNVWFPCIGSEVERKAAELAQLEKENAYDLGKLSQNWPRQYMYLHPVKLSKWKW